MRTNGTRAAVLVAVTLARSGVAATPVKSGKVGREPVFAAISYHPSAGNIAANRRALTRLIVRAAGRGAGFIVLPELCLTGTAPRDPGATAPAAEPIPGPSTEHFAALAGQLGVWIAFGMFERDQSTPKIYVTDVLLDSSGRIARKQRKIMVRLHAEDGNADRGSFRAILDSVDIGGTRIGMVSGDEIHAGVSRLANRGAATILIPAGWTAADTVDWNRAAAELSRENNVNLVIACREGGAAPARFERFHPARRGFAGKPEAAGEVETARFALPGQPWQLHSALGLPASVPTPANDPPTAAMVELGRRLFFDANLSSTGKVACASCHQPDRSFTNGQTKGAGVNGRSTKRNVPTLLNVAFRPLLQWDGYASTLENFAKYPISGVPEMDFNYLDRAPEYLRSEPSYREAFRAAMGVEQIEFEHAARALASYQRSLISADSAFDRYRYGHDRSALTPAAQRGLALFQTKAGCAACHQIRDDYATFADSDFHVTGVGYSAQLDRFSDIGLAAISTADQTGLFQTPSLRNVAETAPYMHDGSLPTLEAVVDYYNRGGERSPRLDPRIRPLGLSAEERNDLVAFLRSLTGSARYGPDGRRLEE
jgi:cytochrome c peroxidase